MSQPSAIRFSTFPRTVPPPPFVGDLVDVFRRHEHRIGTGRGTKGLTSDKVLAVLHDDLVALGFDVESGKGASQKVERPVFFGENGVPTLRYEIDAYHDGWRCGLEVEAGRGFMGNAFYCDLVQAAVMVQVDHLVVALANEYRFSGGASADYARGCAVADALFGHSRVALPYDLVLIGY